MNFAVRNFEGKAKVMLEAKAKVTPGAKAKHGQQYGTKLIV